MPSPIGIMADLTENSFECTLCHPKILRLSRRTHLDEHFRNKHHFCSDCNETLTDRDQMVLHLSDKHGQKVKCDFCTFQSLKLQDIESHETKCKIKSKEKLETKCKIKSNEKLEQVQKELEAIEFSKDGHAQCPKMSLLDAY